jgi:parallel beta-helix repeat protein
MRFLLVVIFLCAVLGLPMGAHAQFTEPAIDGSLRAAPLDPPPVTGSTFYVDINSVGGTCNNSNPGTVLTAPWCTLTKALTTLTAGQRAYVRQGTYTNGNIKPTNSGTAGNYITFEAYPGDAQPVISCTGATFCFDYRTTATSYHVFKGFEISGPTQQIMVCVGANGCHHIWFVGNKIHDNGSTFVGFEMAGFSFVLSNNELYNIGSEGMITITCPSGCFTGHDIIAEFNHVHDNGRNADDAGGLKCGDQAPYNCVMRYNLVHDNYRNPASGVGCFAGNPCQGITGLYLDQGKDAANGGHSYIYNNIVYNNDSGIQVWDSSNVSVFNNVVFHNGFQLGDFSSGAHFGEGIIVDWSASTSIAVANNTVYGNKQRGLMYGNGIATTELTSTNNIVMNNGTGLFFNSGSANSALVDYDLFSGNTTTINWNNTTYTLAAFLARGGNTTYLHAVGTGATFVAAGTTGSADFHLVSGSAGIGQGTAVSFTTFDKDNVSRPQETTWDMGAYEFVPAVTTAPTLLRLVK